jgi:hypothetical protein
VHASEVTAAEVTAAEAAEVTAAEVTAAEAAEVTAAAEVTTAAEVTAAVPTGKGFAHHTRRERSFETEPERDRRCENFCHPTRHHTPFPLPLRNLYPHSGVRSQRVNGSRRSMIF